MTSTLERTGSEPAPASFTNPRPPRSPWRRKLVGGVVALVTVASAVAIPVSMGYLPSVYQPPLPENAALAVDDQVLSVEDYDKRVGTLKALYGAEAPGDPAGQDRFRRDIAKAIATGIVMEQAEADRGIVIPEPRVRGQLNQMITSQFGPGPDGYRVFAQGLGEARTSETEVLGEIRSQMALSELVKQVTDPVQVTDAELPAEFPRFAAQLGVPEQRRLANIVVQTPEQAQDIVNQARGGIPFADIARRVSLDTTTKDAGGDLGQPVPADQLQPGYKEAAFGAPKGQVFGPVQTAQGWNVGQVLDVMPGQPAKYQDVIAPLKNTVLGERKLNAWKDWYSTQIEDADVRYADQYRPADPTGVPPGLSAPGVTPGQTPR